MDYEKLREYVTTENQKKIIDLLTKGNTQEQVANLLGVTRPAITKTVGRIKDKAALQGYSPEHNLDHPVPSVFSVKGTSALYKDGDNKPLLTWVKTTANSKQLELLAEEAAKAFFEDNNPLPPIERQTEIDSELLSCYVLSDLHLGMYSWAKETGDDWNCNTATKTLINGMSTLLTRTPNSKECLIAQLGDLLHLDDDTNQTKRSKHSLDVDTRYERVTQVALKLYRVVIDLCLQKHENVKIVNVRGNHDDISTLWLGVAIETAYENNPRVVVDNSPGPFFYHRFGNNLIGCCHGHTCSMKDLPEIMVEDRPQDVGETNYRYWLTGHIHHERVLDGRVCKCESFRTLAGKDAWHSTKGYRSKRDIKSITYDKLYGECERYTVSIKELEQIDET
jgi:hypothetical protein